MQTPSVRASWGVSRGEVRGNLSSTLRMGQKSAGGPRHTKAHGLAQLSPLRWGLQRDPHGHGGQRWGEAQAHIYMC